MRTPGLTALLTLLTGAATTVVVGLVTADGWPGYVVGAVLAGALWLMLLFGSSARTDHQWSVTLEEYAVASAAGVVLGGAIYLAAGDNAAFWAPGFIIAGVLQPAATSALASTRQRRGQP